MTDLTTGLSTNFDQVGATQQVIMSDSRDFARPQLDQYTTSAPSDFGSADDKPLLLPPDDAIKQFQSFFGLEPTGIVDDKLATAAKGTETKISQILNDTGVKGLLWDEANKKFNTSLNDLQKALNLLKQFEVKKASLSLNDIKYKAYLPFLK